MSITWINRGHFYAPHVRPVLVDCNFQVAPADTAGLGILAGSLKGQGVSNVFMHTSATPGSNNGVLNPNPQNGIISVQLSDNFYKMYQMGHSMHAPNSGSNIVVTAAGAALTVGNFYAITVLGTTTAADWLALGVPPGIVPAVGVGFIALVTGSGVGSGQVQVPAAAGAGINHIEFVGSPSGSLAPIPVGGSPHVGGWVNLACYSNAGGGANVLTAPATGTIIRLSFYMSQSSVVVSGE